MFQIQQDIQTIIPEIEILSQKYGLSVEQLYKLKPHVDNFKVRVPLIGAFSAGKSSLVNALVEKKLLCVEIDPASNLATEISFAEEESIKGYKANQFVKNLTAQELKQQEFSDLMPDGHIEVQLNQPFLALLPHLCLADLPGLDSKSDAHMQAIHHYLGRSLAYVITVSSEEGTLKDSIKKFLQELALHKAPVVVVITKSDKKTPDEIEAIKQQISEQVHSLLPENNYLDVVSVSSKKKDIAEAVEAFQKLENLSEMRFKETVVPQFNRIIDDIASHLTILLNQEDLDTDELKEKQQQLIDETESFKKKLSIEYQKMKEQVPSVLTNVVDHIRNRLLGETDQYATALIGQNNIESDLSYSVRMALTEGMDRYFKPLVDKYIHRIETDLPSLIVNQNFHFEQENTGSAVFDLGLTGITGILTFVLKRFPLAAMILPVVTSIFKAFMSDHNREQQRAEQKEAARDHVRGKIIPQVVEQVQINLGSILQEQLHTVNQQVEDEINHKVTQAQHSISMLEEQLKKNTEERAVLHATYQNDLIIIQNMQQ
ncbi:MULTISPECIES: dynamin family protein [Acinetobacter]|uniref:Dynamin family protein n=1 Tax=Acinetobacter junii TaxID=40215 RepID=A0AAW5RCR6_ACIJU|nr:MULTISPECIES: dynamin family protein [Acinetobacter]MCU4398513.1 dynamin family protein [Acinetobacter junii]